MFPNLVTVSWALQSFADNLNHRHWGFVLLVSLVSFQLLFFSVHTSTVETVKDFGKGRIKWHRLSVIPFETAYFGVVRPDFWRVGCHPWSVDVQWWSACLQGRLARDIKFSSSCIRMVYWVRMVCWVARRLEMTEVMPMAWPCMTSVVFCELFDVPSISSWKRGFSDHDGGCFSWQMTQYFVTWRTFPDSALWFPQS